MTTAIEELWTLLEAEATAGKSGPNGWLLRLARPVAACPLFVALELSSGRRAVLLKLPPSLVPPQREWPQCKGLDPLAVPIGADLHFGVALKERRFADVFSVLAEDLARRVAGSHTSADQASVFIGQLARWQRFLSVVSDGLSQEAQRGLWGELYYLRQHLVPALGPTAVTGWKGPENAHQDFQFTSVAIEVKTTLAKQPQLVRITSERQLDDRAWPFLLLYVVSLEALDHGGETLPALVTSLRAGLAANPAARELFEDALVAAGFFDAHAQKYADRGYFVRTEHSFRVGEGFPRLIETDLPAGVGDLAYGLSIDVCKSFAIQTADAKKILASATTSLPS